jgi:hypothetical protein
VKDRSNTDPHPPATSDDPLAIEDVLLSLDALEGLLASRLDDIETEVSRLGGRLDRLVAGLRRVLKERGDASGR